MLFSSSDPNVQLSHSACQEIPRLLGNSVIGVQKSPPLDPILGQINQVYFLRIHFDPF
jgi:hypothetical protein